MIPQISYQSETFNATTFTRNKNARASLGRIPGIYTPELIMKWILSSIKQKSYLTARWMQVTSMWTVRSRACVCLLCGENKLFSNEFWVNSSNCGTWHKFTDYKLLLLHGLFKMWLCKSERRIASQRAIWKQLWLRNPYTNTKMTDLFEYITQTVYTVYLTPSLAQSC